MLTSHEATRILKIPSRPSARSSLSAYATPPCYPPPPAEVHDIIEQEVEAYREGLPPPNPTWPVDVRALVAELHAYLFDVDLRIKEAEERCGLGDHNISTRFSYYVGECPKAYVDKHRITLVKHLLRHEKLQRVKLIRVAFAVGYGSQSTFTKAFKKHEGRTPGVYRRRGSRRK